MHVYINAMEMLVEQEVEQQIRNLPPKVASYVNRLELTAYALNQLPSLYATSERGLEHQLQRGRAKYAAPIRQAVQRAFIAIQRDPIRSYSPLQTNQSPMMQDVLNRMRLLLKNEKISWDTLPTAVEQAIAITTRTLRGASASSEPSEKSEELTHRRASPSVRRYSGMSASSPFPPSDTAPTSAPTQQLDWTTETPNAPTQRASTPPRNSQASKPGSASPSRTSRTDTTDNGENGGVYGWDDPFCKD